MPKTNSFTRSWATREAANRLKRWPREENQPRCIASNDQSAIDTYYLRIEKQTESIDRCFAERNYLTLTDQRRQMTF